MDLKTYRATFNVTYGEIAELCGCGLPTISRIAHKTLIPSFDLARKIESATNGCVGLDNWFPPRPISIVIGNLSI